MESEENFVLKISKYKDRPSSSPCLLHQIQGCHFLENQGKSENGGRSWKSQQMSGNLPGVSGKNFSSNLSGVPITHIHILSVRIKLSTIII